MEDLRYGLAIEVRADSLEFTARLEISARELPSSLVLDSVGHAIRAVTSGGKALRYVHEPAQNRLTIPEIPGGTREVSIDYAGTIDDPGLRGFYVTPLGSGRAYTTYFEPAGARRFLPCLDRPDAKAVFVVEVTGPASGTVISNTEVERTESLPDGRRRIRFHPTPPMSTYLLYLGIGPFEELSGERRDPRVIVATAPGRSAGTRFSLEQAERSVAYFAQYYALPYPLAKLHLIAVPQFGTGAMENWGAIAFQEYLLIHDERTAAGARMRAVEVIAHEVAHQWFGNLVTMRWWNDLWLNESFASFVAVKATEAMFPEWSPWDDFLGGGFANALVWDGLPHTHPIRVEVRDPQEIRQIFDEISYGKGASVLRMAEGYVGEEAFRRGVSRYLAEHARGNAEAQDLWRAVGAASREPVERVFAAWIDRPGHPLVTARLDGTTLRLEQRRFSSLEQIPADPWPIPLHVRTKDRMHRSLFEGRSTDVPDAGPAPLVNPGRPGFYRVRYDGVLRERILERFAELSPVDRWAIQDDARALLFSGDYDLPTYLDVFRRLEGETDLFVVSTVSDSFRALYPLVHRIPRWEEAYRAFVVAQSERLEPAPAPGEPDRVRSLRGSITVDRVLLDPPFSRRLAAEFPRVDALSPDLVRAALLAYGLGAGPSEYAALRERYARAATPDAQRQVASALGAVGRAEWVREGLEAGLARTIMLGPWLELFGSSLVLNPERSGAVWSFLTERLGAFLSFTAGLGVQGLFLQRAVPLLGLDRPAEMRAWAAQETFPESARAVTKGLDLLEVFTRLLARVR
ncbi:MAG TPA: M1 family metallopeptidase [Thermoplasmata archaeon]|nr:M1 family metallopeptidase [Thermoplasmata archaeon]